MSSYNCDVLIIGSGAAGLTAALTLPDHLRITVLSKGILSNGSTAWAQGGIAAVLDDHDTVESHVSDTLSAGAGLCHKDAVHFTVSNSRTAIEWLIEQGVNFTRAEADANQTSAYHLTQEGGHSQRRIIHAADATGAEIFKTLVDLAHKRTNITLLEQRVAVDLITSRRVGSDTALGEKQNSTLQEKQNKDHSPVCLGAFVLNRDNGVIETFAARFIILATGSAAKVYLYASTPDGATGDGIAMAWRAGCSVANLEFNQFHPTCLYHRDAKNFLISEAVRGEGGLLRLPNGERFMLRFDERAELAPRDIVARAIDHEMKRLGLDCVYLDITHQSPAFIREHFPTIYERCLSLGIDITQEPIPVVPAAHYTCGGVCVNPQGETDLSQLYAIGETAFTGLHGANRMASNSLLECIVFARACSAHIQSIASKIPYPPDLPMWDASQVTDSDEDIVITHNWEELRRFMWDYVGIVRTTKRLLRAKHRVKMLLLEIHEFYSHFKITRDLLELRNLVVVADLMIQCALKRQESRGLHYTLDHPQMSVPAEDTILIPPIPATPRSKA